MKSNFLILCFHHTAQFLRMRNIIKHKTKTHMGKLFNKRNLISNLFSKVAVFKLFYRLTP